MVQSRTLVRKSLWVPGGINTGFCMSVISEARIGWSVEANLAAHLQSIAEPGQIVLIKKEPAEAGSQVSLLLLVIILSVAVRRLAVLAVVLFTLRHVAALVPGRAATLATLLLTALAGRRRSVAILLFAPPSI